MSNFSHFFSRLSLFLALIATLLLGTLYRHLTVLQMTTLAESRNVSSAQILENALLRPIDAVLALSLTTAPDQLAATPEVREARAQIVRLFRDSGVIRLSIHNRHGMVVLSTAMSEIGEKRSQSTAFRQAMTGSVFSERSHPAQFEDFDGRPLDPYLLVSHVPLFAADRSIMGVLELHQDVTPMVAELQRGLWLAGLAIASIEWALCLLQFLGVRRVQRVLDDQEKRIAAARDTMEIRVEARTSELRKANRKLEEEIVERQAVEHKLNYLAYHDTLTGLANRRGFIERLTHCLESPPAQRRPLAVLFIDLDQFKQVNDSLGHGVGDELLVAVANRLIEQVPLIDMLARLGGDEFICLMESFGERRDVATLAAEIVAAFDQPFRIDMHELFLSVSVGISLFPEDGNTPMELLRNADAAMYRAKARARGQFDFYTPELTSAATERIRIESLLRRAIGSPELSVHLQPQVDSRTGRLVGAEALLRWQSPELGSVSPARFIPVAEESGIIVPLGHWVLQETCRQVMYWQRSGFMLPQVSVNLSVRQLERPDFIEALRTILTESGLSPSRLKLEITESVVLAIKDASLLLERLRQLGVSLALDDFGTGYSSLSYLKLLPVQQLKIDQSFVVGIGRNPGDEAIIRSVMTLARSLNFEVVAEGVETLEQAEFLTRQGCERLQGFLHGRAVSPAEFRARWSETR